MCKLLYAPVSSPVAPALPLPAVRHSILAHIRSPVAAILTVAIVFPSAIYIHSQIHITSQELRVTQPCIPDSAYDTRYTAAPVLYEIHICKCFGDSFVPDLRMSILHTAHGLTHRQLPR